MSDTVMTQSGRESDGMLPEYNLDYSKARPNHFATKVIKDRLMVLLDPDVSESVHYTGVGKSDSSRLDC